MVLSCERSEKKTPSPKKFPSVFSHATSRTQSTKLNPTGPTLFSFAVSDELSRANAAVRRTWDCQRDCRVSQLVLLSLSKLCGMFIDYCVCVCSLRVGRPCSMHRHSMPPYLVFLSQDVLFLCVVCVVVMAIACGRLFSTRRVSRSVGGIIGIIFCRCIVLGIVMCPLHRASTHTTTTYPARHPRRNEMLRALPCRLSGGQEGAQRRLALQRRLSSTRAYNGSCPKRGRRQEGQAESFFCSPKQFPCTRRPTVSTVLPHRSSSSVLSSLLTLSLCLHL